MHLKVFAMVVLAHVSESSGTSAGSNTLVTTAHVQQQAHFLDYTEFKL